MVSVENWFPVSRTVGVTGCPEASAAIPENCQPLARNRAIGESLCVTVGCHVQLKTARCRWSVGRLPLSLNEPSGVLVTGITFAYSGPVFVPVACDHV